MNRLLRSPKPTSLGPVSRLLLAGAVFLVAPAPTSALEAAHLRFTVRDQGPEWNSAASCQVTYANACTGWLWAWGNWNTENTLGTVFETCCDPGATTTLVDSRIRFQTGAPTGYGYTGTIAVYQADANSCPTGLPLDSKPWLPVAGDNECTWGIGVPDRFVVLATLGGTGNPAFVMSDYPAAGPTGPQACGACYPSTRVTRSFFYGTPGSPLCPGTPLFDGVCNAEWSIEVGLNCETGPTSVQAETWARVKSLYR